MASQKRRKAYLDPESTASVPRATKWRLSSSASGTLGSSRASRRAAVQADESPSPSNSPQPLCNNSEDESQSSWHRTDTNYADFELTGESDDDYSDWAGEDSERVTFPCGTSFSDHEDEVPSFEFDQPCDSFNVEELALPFIEDSPARAAMQHMVQFNGYYGCSWCYHPGVNVDGTVKYCLTTPFLDRTDKEAIQDMTDACNTGTTVRGVKGP
ncbi:hypothetical protein HPB52_008333 [Rhipicephalus sanguineus]|uniref:Uncharacterized protein n=1 Tax=Rhipicephalus sanguineus TaxID=34632 RepID=A0A9D4PG16_RHISA|nr:hypothetical protein HPB52_008333 [Rhipicephalus sanguineus]